VWRRLIAEEQLSAIDADPRYFIDRLKEEQLALLKLRIWRATGQYPLKTDESDPLRNA
jgi:hypothetical protein